MCKDSWDSLTVQLFSWLVALMLLVFVVGAGLVKYGDLADAFRVLK